jgi:hypothetical protein
VYEKLKKEEAEGKNNRRNRGKVGKEMKEGRKR